MKTEYLILITEESKPVLVEPVDGSEFKFYQFKDEAFAMELVRKLSNNENDFFGVGQTFPLPDNIIVSFEYLCNCQLQTLRGTPTMCFTCLRPGEHKLAILSKLEEEKTGTPKSRNRPAPPVVAPSEEVKQGWISVKDRLPDSMRLVIVSGGVAYYLNGVWKSCTYCDGIPIEWEVKYWMELPKAPLE